MLVKTSLSIIDGMLQIYKDNTTFFLEILEIMFKFSINRDLCC